MSTWSYKGTLLDSLGIVTLVSDSLQMPQRRGENMLIPFRAGRVFAAKEFEQRSMALGLEVHGDTRAELEAAVDAVKTLFGGRALGTLQQTLADLTVRTAQAELMGDLDVTPVSPHAVKMVLNFVLPDPFFYGSTVEGSVMVDASPKALAVSNPSTVEARDPTIVLTGPLENTEITNSENGVSVKYNAAIASPRVVTISKAATGEYVATDDLGANVIGNVTHSGAASLFALEPGNNDLSITDDVATTGEVELSFYPPYL